MIHNATAGNGLLSAAAIVALSGLVSRLLGLLRDRLLAGTFGAGDILDAYFAAYRIPDLIYNLLVVGALAAAFLPVVSEYLERGHEGRREAYRLANALLAVSVLALAALSLVLAVFAPVLLGLVAPGFGNAQRALTVLFTRIMLLQPILLGLSSIVSGLLLAHHRFFAYAAAPVLYNLGIILGVLFFVPALGPVGLAWGVVLGAVLHVAVQLPALVRTGFRLRPTFRLWHPGVATISALFLPRLIGLLAGQVSGLVVTVVGSGLLAGSIAAYLLAENLQAVPIGIVGVSLAVAAFPFLSSAAARNDVAGFSGTLVRGLRILFFLTLPASVFLLLLRAQVVRVVLGAGAFDWEDTQATFTVLGILALSVVAQSTVPLLARAFFSLHDTRTPMWASLAAIAANIAGAVLLAPRWGVAGLAAAFTGASLLHFLVLLAFLHQRLRGLQDRLLFGSIARAALATLLAALVIQGPAILFVSPSAEIDGLPAVALGLKGIIASAVNMQTFMGVATQLVGSLAGGFAVYLLTAWLLRAGELSLLRELFRPRFRLPSALANATTSSERIT